MTGDIPQRTASDDDFDVEYVTEHSSRGTAAPQTQERAPASEKPARTVKSEAELREAYLDMLERVISRELGKEAEEQNEVAKDISAETGKTVPSNPSQNTAEAAARRQRIHWKLAGTHRTRLRSMHTKIIQTSKQIRQTVLQKLQHMPRRTAQNMNQNKLLKAQHMKLAGMNQTKLPRAQHMKLAGMNQTKLLKAYHI